MAGPARRPGRSARGGPPRGRPGRKRGTAREPSLDGAGSRAPSRCRCCQRRGRPTRQPSERSARRRRSACLSTDRPGTSATMPAPDRAASHPTTTAAGLRSAGSVSTDALCCRAVPTARSPCRARQRSSILVGRWSMPSAISTNAPHDSAPPAAMRDIVSLAGARPTVLLRLGVLLICAGARASSALVVVVGERRAVVGGLWARWGGWVWCARVPGLISVRDRRSVGDVMGDGVFAEDALRPPNLWRPSTERWRQQHAGSRPRCIGLMKDWARTSAGVQAASRASSPSSRRVWKLRLSGLRASARQARLPPRRSAAWS
jgi:hypothetical protein